MKQKLPLFRNHPEWIAAWMIAAEKFSARFPTIESPAAHLVRRHGGGLPACASCWDTGLCVECLGRYPQYCPSECGDGTCTCDAGQARRAAYQESLKEFGL